MSTEPGPTESEQTQPRTAGVGADDDEGALPVAVLAGVGGTALALLVIAGTLLALRR